LRHAEALLAEGLVVGMFPEGTRSRSGGLKEPYAGASMVALRTNAPIVPCAIIGSDGLPLSGFPPHQRRRWPRIDILFGPPFVLEHLKPDGTRWKLDELTDAMMIEIARLLPPPYRGLYADRASASHPAVRHIDPNASRR
jgi:1-acyl-sn-glycerol-3-phosphate acyltransferase